MISLASVYKRYTREYYALSNITFEVKRGEILALVGPKDSGKTCIMRILAGIEKPDKGEVYIKNFPLDKIDYSLDVSMGYLPYKTIFFEKKTVYDNLKYVLEIRKTEKSLIEEKINQAVIDFRLESIINTKVGKLTNYERYLVSIARLSFRKLEIVLIDNIFEELSNAENKELFKLFKKYFFKPNTTIVIATSDEALARSVTNHIIYLKYGAIEKEEE